MRELAARDDRSLSALVRGVPLEWLARRGDDRVA